MWQGGCVWDGRSVVPEVARAGRLQLAVSCERSVQPPAAASGARPGHASGSTGICVSLRRSVDEAASCSVLKLDLIPVSWNSVTGVDLAIFMNHLVVSQATHLLSTCTHVVTVGK